MSNTSDRALLGGFRGSQGRIQKDLKRPFSDANSHICRLVKGQAAICSNAPLTVCGMTDIHLNSCTAGEEEYGRHLRPRLAAVFFRLGKMNDVRPAANRAPRSECERHLVTGSNLYLAPFHVGLNRQTYCVPRNILKAGSSINELIWCYSNS